MGTLCHRVTRMFLAAPAILFAVDVLADEPAGEILIVPGAVRIGEGDDGLNRVPQARPLRKPIQQTVPQRRTVSAAADVTSGSADGVGGFQAYPNSFSAQRPRMDREPQSNPCEESNSFAPRSSLVRQAAEFETEEYGEMRTVVAGSSQRAFDNGRIVPVSATRSSRTSLRKRAIEPRRPAPESQLAQEQSFAPARSQEVREPVRERALTAKPSEQQVAALSRPEPARPALHQREAPFEITSQQYSIWKPTAAAPIIDASAAKTEIQWYSDLHMARLAAVQSGRPLLISVISEQCPHCEELNEDVFGDLQVIETVTTQFIPVRLKVEQESDRRVAELLGIDRIPTTLVLSPEADLIGRIVGAFDAPFFVDSLSTAIEKISDTGSVETADGYFLPSK